MRKVIMAMAHPDDEVIFGWPILFDETLERHLVVFSSDAFNKNRKWCMNRKEATYRICDTLGVAVTVFDLDSEFYRMPTRDETLMTAMNEIMTFILSLEGDEIFTHNDFGEYGHLDHILIHSLMQRLSTDIITTDIRIQTNWLPLMRFPGFSDRNYYKECTLNQNLYHECQKEYEKLGCWTWNQPPITKCNLLKGYKCIYQ